MRELIFGLAITFAVYNSDAAYVDFVGNKVIIEKSDTVCTYEIDSKDFKANDSEAIAKKAIAFCKKEKNNESKNVLQKQTF